MVRKQGHERGTGPYSTNNVTFHRPTNIDDSGNPTDRPRRVDVDKGQNGDGRPAPVSDR